MKLAVCILIPQLDRHRPGNAEAYLSVSRRDDATQWGVPGGKVDPNEDAVTALIRETFEELGIRVRAEDLVPIFSEVCPGKGPEDTYWVTTYLWGRPPGPLTQQIVTEPGFEAAWCNETTLTDPATSPFAQYNVGLLAAYRRFTARISARGAVEKLHPTQVTTVLGSADLGREVMSLRYDLVRDTLQGMLEEIVRQVQADNARGRPQLAAHLSTLRTSLAATVNDAHKLTEFCRPWIDAERKEHFIEH